MKFNFNNFLSKYLLVIAVFIFFIPINSWSQTTYVPDDNFENYLEANGMGDGIALNDSVFTYNINTVTNLTISSLSISDLTGIEDFAALSVLDAQGNGSLTSVDLSQNSLLSDARFNSCNLGSLDLSNNTQLTILTCGGNNLTALDVSNNSLLTTLDCWSNLISVLDLSQNTALTSINCNSNQISSLDFSNSPNMTSISCNSNQLSSLDVTNLTALQILWCPGNSISVLDLSQNSQLNTIRCENNTLHRLDVKNGNNTNVTQFFTTGNPSLECINVDDSTYSANNWTNIDSQQYFGESCYCSLIVNSQTNVSCYGGYDGSLILTGTGGTGYYNYVLGFLNQFTGTLIPFTNTGTGFYATPINLTNVPANCYTATISDSLGCADTTTICITEPDSIYSITTMTQCNQVIWNFNTYNSSGIYNAVLTAANGCDSSAILDVTLIFSDSSFSTINSCDSYIWNGTTYTSSGTFTYTSLGSNGCDSVAVLNLTINNSSTNTVIATSCDSYIWGGVTYTSTGLYSNTYTGLNGCDSTVVLDLTINNSSTNTLTVISCDSYNWDGVTYTSTGLYTNIYTSLNGCDSTVILDLTINNSSTNTVTVTSCDNYVWDGLTYTLTGLYTNIYTSLNGCDSTVILDLTINNSSTNTVSVNSCDSYDWDGVTYTLSGQYINVYTALNGCDSTVTLDLILTYSDTSFMNITACDSFTLNDVSYNQSGLYYQTLSADSLIGFNYVGTYDGSTYYISENPQYWGIAQSNCIANGGNLVCISDANENDFVSNILPGQQFWLGYTDETVEGSFVWVDGSTHTYTKWSPTEPSNSGPTGNEDYTLINSGEGGSNPLDGFWNDVDDNLSQYLYVLELPYSHLTSNGCDSVIALNLTINVSDTSYTNITACDSVEWNGTWYDSSGTYYSNISLNNNYSMSFDGIDDFISCQNNITGNYSEFSIEGWINVNNFPNVNSGKIVDIGGPNSRFIVETKSNQSLHFEISENNILQDGLASVVGLQSNEWIHFVAVWDSDQYVKLFINGNEASSNVIPPNLTSINLSSQAGIFFGSRYSNSDFFDGLIDRLSIWGKALDEIEIQNFMNCPPNGSENELYGLWNFEEGNGNTAYDQTSNGNDGTINGASYDTNVPIQSCQLTNINGCDSVAVLNLTINNSSYTTDSITICEGSNIVVGTNIYDTSGVYVDTLQSVNGCDSIINTILEIINVNINQNDTAICLGDSIVLSVNSSFSNYSDTNTQSLQFNYGQYATIPNNGSLLNDTTYTIEFWYKETGFSGGDEHIFGNDWFSSKIYFSRGGGNVNFLRGNSLSTTNIQNQWNHYAGVRDGNTVYFFIDGVLVDSEPYNNSISTSLTDFTINHHTWNSGNSARLSGFFDELRISNVARYTSSFNPPNYEFITDSNTLYLLHFNGNILDEINNNGTLNGANFSSDVPFSSFTQITSNNNTFLWSTGDTNSSITVAPSQTTTYYITQIQNGISCTDSITITVLDTSITNMNVTSCDSYDWDGVTYTTTGQYVNIYTGNNGCDSTVILDLTINNSSTNTVTVTACDSYDWDGVTYTTTGQYVNIYTGNNGCDSTVTLDLTINNSSTNTVTVTACDSYDWDGVTYTTTGQYVNVYTGNNGCDSTVTLDLTINNSSTNTVTVTACDSYDWDGVTYTLTGLYTNVYVAVNGCDSTVTLDLTINNSSTNTVTVTACDSYDWDGVTYTSTGQYTNLYTDTNGCDSTVTLDLIINNSSTNTVIVTSCDSYDWDGVTYTTTGQYVNIYTGNNGCDSTVTLDLTINNSSTNTVTVTACDSYDWDGVTYTLTGLYTNVYVAVNGCDSTVTLDLTINNSSTNTVTVTACDSYDWDGVTYTSTGQYTNLYTDTNGCDSTVTLDLTINNSSTNTVTVTACDSYDWDGVTYTTTGQYVNVYTGNNGCDSTVTLDLTINNSSTNTVTVTACDSYDWDGVTYTLTGLYTNVYVAVNGCDSTVTLDLTINNSSTNTVTVTACDSYDWDGVTYTSTGQYTNLYTDTNGCDSTVTLDLIINNSSTNTVIVTSCDSYDWDGVTYTTTGQYVNIYTGNNGCDSTVTLDLTINNSFTSSFNITACDSYDWDGVTYTLTGLYTNVYVAVNGCDSTVTLDLTINNSSTNTVTVTACDSYDWDGVTYTTSGQYTNLYTDTNGCDSTVTLDLTINNSFTSSFNITACDSYDWDSVTYTSTGLYTNIYTALNGCDSAVTLFLNIINSTVNYLTVTECDSYTWDGVTYTSTGLYSNTYTALNGCDSIVTLDLIIISSPVIVQSDTTICYGDSITLETDLSSQISNSQDVCLLSEISSNLQNDLVAYYPFCGNANDISLNSNNGNVIGANLSTNRFGDSLNSYVFDGVGDYIELVNSTSFSSLDSNISISSWIYPENYNDGTIIDRDICGNSPDWHLSWRGNGNAARVLLRVNNQSLYSGNYNSNQWLHIVAVKNNTNFELYINNQFQGSVPVPINLINTSLPIYIGDQVCNSSSEPNFDGRIDDVGVWSRALDSSEVNQLYNSNFPQYVWSTGDSAATITIVPTQTTTYILEKIDNGISCFDSVTVTVNDTSSSFSQAVSCDNYTWNGITYSTSGLYSFTSTNYVGCDSIAFLDLTINNEYDIIDSIGICPGDSILITGNYYSTLGTYVDSFFTNSGCDSIVTTVLSYLPIGCTDSTSFNYDPLAQCDDNSCIMAIYGCLDSNAINYYPSANFDDGSCIYLGCTDSTASNYNPAASIDDGSCVYAFCSDPVPFGFFTNDITDTKARINWNDMNDSACMVWKYFVRYREVGTNTWITKSAGVGSGLCNVGLNTTSKVLQNLNPSTTYEYKMKAFYCGGTESSYSSPVQFTTGDLCPEMTNLSAQTFYFNPNKVRFNWDTTGLYTFARIVLRVDSIGSSWQGAGGYGIYYPNLSVNKYGMQPGEFYRAQGRTFCDSNITSYRSWWTPPIFWQQPGSSRLNGGNTISNLDVYPNPSRDIFNISFVSEELQNLKLRILNILGEEIYVEKKEQYIGEYTKQINLNEDRKGVYFLEIETNNGVINKKLIFQ